MINSALVDTENPRTKSLHEELREVLNRHSVENASNTPDFILAQYLIGCLYNLGLVIETRREWYAKPLPIEQVAGSMTLAGSDPGP